MSPLVFSLTVCGVLLGFSPSGGTPAHAAPLASGAWLGTPSSVEGAVLEALGPPLNYASGQSVGEAALGALGPLPPTTPPEDDSPLCVEHGLVHLIGGSGGEGHNRGASY